MHNQDLSGLHVGIIMDGNGRWAQARRLSRLAGHVQGARRVTDIVRVCPDLGVTHLTLYAFSTENWRRPVAEIDALMRIFRQYIVGRMEALRRHDVRVRFIGMRHRIPARLRVLMETLEARTRGCRGLNLTIAIDYGGRDELTRALAGIAREVADGGLRPEDISEALIGGRLDTRALPDPDFVIRTSGEMRVSNFLTWQGVYAEFDFPETCWPDFTVDAFAEAVEGFRARNRRFGGVAARPALAAAQGG